jgi:hypothetical protein
VVCTVHPSIHPSITHSPIPVFIDWSPQEAKLQRRQYSKDHGWSSRWETTVITCMPVLSSSFLLLGLFMHARIQFLPFSTASWSIPFNSTRSPIVYPGVVFM